MRKGGGERESARDVRRERGREREKERERDLARGRKYFARGFCLKKTWGERTTLIFRKEATDTKYKYT